MAEEQGKADAQLFQLLSNLLQQVEALTNQEEVELRSKIEALGLEVTKVPSNSTQLDELEIARELDKLSAKLDDVDEMISSATAADPQVQSLLSGTADVWMPVITATVDERRNFTGSVGDDNTRANRKKLQTSVVVNIAENCMIIEFLRKQRSCVSHSVDKELSKVKLISDFLSSPFGNINGGLWDRNENNQFSLIFSLPWATYYD
ncbi:hypothetical protein Patl1_17297 [Pistacia atlantica]|uniref:Uncharacterized protein n=1 Tax=Pistacia atlantica TaxID=434234 RepID=A0ACC1B9Z0_9ROSI|nr:hypothetical protein Patl1_17297 [Pistacia atlantica]